MNTKVLLLINLTSSKHRVFFSVVQSISRARYLLHYKPVWFASSSFASSNCVSQFSNVENSSSQLVQGSEKTKIMQSVVPSTETTGTELDPILVTIENSEKISSLLDFVTNSTGWDNFHVFEALRKLSELASNQGTSHPIEDNWLHHSGTLRLSQLLLRKSRFYPPNAAVKVLDRLRILGLTANNALVHHYLGLCLHHVNDLTIVQLVRLTLTTGNFTGTKRAGALMKLCLARLSLDKFKLTNIDCSPQLIFSLLHLLQSEGADSDLIQSAVFGAVRLRYKMDFLQVIRLLKLINKLDIHSRPAFASLFSSLRKKHRSFSNSGLLHLLHLCDDISLYDSELISAVLNTIETRTDVDNTTVSNILVTLNKLLYVPDDSLFKKFDEIVCNEIETANSGSVSAEFLNSRLAPLLLTRPDMVLTCPQLIWRFVEELPTYKNGDVSRSEILSLLLRMYSFLPSQRDKILAFLKIHSAENIVMDRLPPEEQLLLHCLLSETNNSLAAGFYLPANAVESLVSAGQDRFSVSLFPETESQEFLENQSFGLLLLKLQPALIKESNDIHHDADNCVETSSPSMPNADVVVVPFTSVSFVRNSPRLSRIGESILERVGTVMNVTALPINVEILTEQPSDDIDEFSVNFLDRIPHNVAGNKFTLAVDPTEDLAFHRDLLRQQQKSRLRSRRPSGKIRTLS